METLASTTRPQSFPKYFRLLKKKDFFFRPYRKLDTEHFLFVYGENGHGRLGISIAKKVLKNAVQRNRVKRLLREGFRKNRNDFQHLDIHVLAKEPLRKDWDSLSLLSVSNELLKLTSV